MRWSLHGGHEKEDFVCLETLSYQYNSEELLFIPFFRIHEILHLCDKCLMNLKSRWELIPFIKALFETMNFRVEKCMDFDARK